MRGNNGGDVGNTFNSSLIIQWKLGSLVMKISLFSTRKAGMKNTLTHIQQSDENEREEF